MTDAQRIASMRLFIAALQKLLATVAEKPIPFDPESFARTAKDLAGQGNKFAEKFPVFRTVAGPGCPDFQEGMTVAQSAGLISRQNPTHETFLIKASRRQLSGLSGEQEFSAATEVARQYLRLTSPSLNL